MRLVYRYLSFQRIKGLSKTLEKLDIKYKVEEKQYTPTMDYYSIEFFLYSDDPYFKQKHRIITKFNIEPQVGTDYDFTDFENANWFLIEVGEYQYPQPDSDFGYREMTFNLDNYCRACGIGKVQNNPFRLKTEPKQTCLQFWGLHWEFSAVFVREAAKNILKKENVKGIRFTQPVLHKKNIEIEGFYQLHIDTVLAKGFDSYNSKIITCKYNNEENCNNDKNRKYCGRIKYHHPHVGGYCFNKEIFNPEYDIVETFEYFGGGASANKLNIASKRFKEIVEKNHLKGIRFIPIVHERHYFND